MPHHRQFNIYTLYSEQTQPAYSNLLCYTLRARDAYQTGIRARALGELKREPLDEI